MTHDKNIFKTYSVKRHCIELKLKKVLHMHFDAQVIGVICYKFIM